jgi:hypothetical protein
VVEKVSSFPLFPKTGWFRVVWNTKQFSSINFRAKKRRKRRKDCWRCWRVHAFSISLSRSFSQSTATSVSFDVWILVYFETLSFPRESLHTLSRTVIHLHLNTHQTYV